MALIDKASLLMVPSTYEAGKLYNVLPSGNRAPDNKGGAGYDQTRADFDFDRGSNAAATRINSSGLIEKYRENKLLQSNNFGTTWVTAASITRTSGQSGYDGTNDAWKIETDGSTGFDSVYQSVSISGVTTYSIYAKAGTNNILSLRSAAAVDARAFFNLSTSSVSRNSAAINASIESVGNDWYRCSMIFSATNSLVYIYPNDFGVASAGYILIQDAQLESGLVATDVLTSGATTAKAGVLIDLPRINYDANGENGALLLEPSRANSHIHSEYLADSYWLKYQCSITANQAISPDGTNNASLFTANVSGVNVIYRSSVSYGALSFFAKADNLSAGARFHIAVDTIGSANWNQDGTLYSQSGGLVSATDGEDYGNGWYRFTYVVGSGSVQNFGLSNSTSGDTCHIWGVQSEPSASYATSYIPNHGTSGGVTRAADSCISSSLTTSTDFTIFFEAKDFCLINGSTGGSYDNVQFVFSPSGGPYDGGGSYHIYGNSLYYYNGSTNTSFGLIYNNQTDSKFALVKRGNQGILYANGVKKTELTLPSGADAKVINWDAINLTSSLQDAQGDVFGSNYKQLVKFDEALTDSELATLTTS